MYLNTVFKYNVFKYCPALDATHTYIHDKNHTKAISYLVIYLVNILH